MGKLVRRTVVEHVRLGAEQQSFQLSCGGFFNPKAFVKGIESFSSNGIGH
jgi:hypothetical protein